MHLKKDVESEIMQKIQSLLPLSIALFVFQSCSQVNTNKIYGPSYLDSVVNSIEDSLAKIEKTKIDSTVRALAFEEVNQQKQNKVTIPGRTPANYKPAPAVTPQIDKDSFELLK